MNDEFLNGLSVISKTLHLIPFTFIKYSFYTNDIIKEIILLKNKTENIYWTNLNKLLKNNKTKIKTLKNNPFTKFVPFFVIYQYFYEKDVKL
mgnify:CR=1 FL=1